METIYIINSRVILNFDRRIFESSTLYSVSMLNIEDLKIPTPTIKDDPNIEIFFTKLLFSNHELDTYKRMKEENIAPKMVGISKNSLGTFLILEKMNIFTHNIFIMNEKWWVIVIISKFNKMQELGIIHRDIRMDNLLTKNGDIFFCDFEDKGYSLRWSPWEVINNGHFSVKSDIYSLGCLLIELISGEYPWGFYEDFEKDIERNDFSNLLFPIKEHWAFELIHGCIVERCVLELK